MRREATGNSRTKTFQDPFDSIGRRLEAGGVREKSESKS
jgi:hypothetical protein